MLTDLKPSHMMHNAPKPGQAGALCETRLTMIDSDSTTKMTAELAERLDTASPQFPAQMSNPFANLMVGPPAAPPDDRSISKPAVPQEKRLELCGQWGKKFDELTGLPNSFRYRCGLFRHCFSCANDRARMYRERIQDAVAADKTVYFRLFPNTTLSHQELILSNELL